MRDNGEARYNRGDRGRELARVTRGVYGREAMRNTLAPTAREALSARVAQHGTLAVAVAIGTTLDTLRAARRGHRLNGGTCTAIAAYLSTEGAPAQRLVA